MRHEGFQCHMLAGASTLSRHTFWITSLPLEFTAALPETLELASRFRESFGRDASHAASAPGRVNLIGEHTDYNDGFVLPLAIDRRVFVVAAPRDDDTVCVRSTGVSGEMLLNLREPGGPGKPAWGNYVRGPIALAANEGWSTRGFDAMVHSTVPAGGGLSSSAALEVATLTLVESLAGKPMDPVQRALLAQKAEHEYAGVPCGIMDQYASSLGRTGHALLIDCRDQSARQVALDDPEVVVLIINSKVKHALNGGEYAQRRHECELAADTLQVQALRDASLDQLEAARSSLDAIRYRRARHVITENQRTLDAADALARRDYGTVGDLMFASHASLRDDFEVSTFELDRLVALAESRREDGVIGSRMTGGGFGGCTVTLVRRSRVEAVMERICVEYRQATGIDPEAFVTTPSRGATVEQI